jgi:hypothetical protein
LGSGVFPSPAALAFLPALTDSRKRYSRRSSRRCGSDASAGPAGPRSSARPGRSAPSLRRPGCW